MQRTLVIYLSLILILGIIASIGISAYAEESTGSTFPEFEWVTRVYDTLDETDFPVEEIRNFFPNEVETKYENGKYMVKDIGAFGAKLYETITYDRKTMVLENGYWTLEISEEEYNAVRDAGGDYIVNLFAKDNLWQVNYSNGRIKYDLQIATRENTYAVLIKLSSDFVAFIYPLYDRDYRDTYSGGVLASQEVTFFIDYNNFVVVHYFNDGTHDYTAVFVSSVGSYRYYVQDFGWAIIPEADPDYACDAPPGYEDADTEFFTSLAPTSINCTHEQYNVADCATPERCAICGLVKEGSEPLGHDMAEATCTEPSTCKNGCGHTEGIPFGHDIVIDEAVDPTCVETGLTDGSHCSRCDEETIEQETVPALGHDYDDGAVTTAPTCTENGVRTFVCQNDENHTIIEKVEALGHKYDNACDAGCNNCDEERTPAEHYSENADGQCDECGEQFELSGGAIAGIAVGSAAGLGGGGFALFWFVIRKKRII